MLIANDSLKGLRESLTSAEKKIEGFERICAAFAERLDEINSDFIFLTGKSYDEWLDVDKQAASSQADGFGG